MVKSICSSLLDLDFDKRNSEITEDISSLIVVKGLYLLNK